MASGAKRITVCSLEFSAPPFRKLGNLKIEFSERINIIAGHNGIGKSTILGLVANTFGDTSTGGPRSYFGEPFYANIERIVYLALDEVTKAQEHPTAAPIVVANVNGGLVQKRCSMTQRGQWKRARVVPRTVDRADDDFVGQDAKVPLPTIYLGIRRLAPIGEADEKEVHSTRLTMDDQDSQLMADFVRSVILGSQVNTEVTHLSIKGSKKRSAHPGYQNHDALAISMGQDSLGSIATALASFNRLKRELGTDYVGGLLIIDELDVGFHPHAIDRLAQALKTYAKRLNLQVIATTHSPRLIEAIHPEGSGDLRAPDAVFYLLDTTSPRLAEDQSLTAILDDLALRQDLAVGVSKRKPILSVYFEDPEGMDFCDALVPARKRGAIGSRNGVQLKLIPLGVGGSNLVAMPEKDPIFNHRVLIVDADTTIPNKAAARGNTIKLPCPTGAAGTNRSPENVIKNFLRNAANATDGPLRDALLRFTVRNPSSDRIRSTFFADDTGDSNARGSSKSWWVTHSEMLRQWHVIREWANCHKREAEAFVSAFEAAVACTAKRVK